MNNITVNLYYHLKEKAGTNIIHIEIPKDSTMRDLKRILITNYPTLESQLDNIMMLINQKIAVDEDKIPLGAQVSFLSPIGGG
jgi:molybdopterin converting factor small subunit